MYPGAALMRVYTDESAYFGDRKVFEYISTMARDQELAGVTVLEALIGFGHSAHLHRRHVLESDRAVVIEIVDAEEKLRRFAKDLADITDIGLITISPVEVIGGKTPQTHGGEA